MKWNKAILTILLGTLLVPNFSYSMHATIACLARQGGKAASKVAPQAAKSGINLAKQAFTGLAALCAAGLSTVGITSFNGASSATADMAAQALAQAAAAQATATTAQITATTAQTTAAAAQITADAALNGVQTLQEAATVAASELALTPTTELKNFTTLSFALEALKNITYGLKDIIIHPSQAPGYIWKNSGEVLINGAKAYPGLATATVVAGVIATYYGYKLIKKAALAENMRRKIWEQRNQGQVNMALTTPQQNGNNQQQQQQYDTLEEFEKRHPGTTINTYQQQAHELRSNNLPWPVRKLVNFFAWIQRS